MRSERVLVNDLMQADYAYFLTEPGGQNFAEDFSPGLTPKEMLSAPNATLPV